MNERIKKILKFSLFALLAIFVILLTIGVVLSFQWPWWVGFFILLLMAGLVVGGVFLRKMWLRRREENFVNEISERDQAAAKALSGRDGNDGRELAERWKSAIDTLRHSHLKKLGNPLYVLPWYMMMGESGSGKTTALTSARLPSPLQDANRVTGVSGTKQCEWWFFEQSIVIDTAGRYAMPVNEAQDKQEWQKFLSLLLKYRRKEPLNGLILTIAADRLLKAGPEDLKREGNILRQRIDELMRALAVRVPVYLLVTKCDLIQGVDDFTRILPEKSLDQPMGIINQDLSIDIEGFLTRALNTIDERLRNLRLHLLHQPEAKGVDGKGMEPGLFLFPEEFESLKQGLTAFMTTAFKENPYQETPLLRGLFFSSGRQEGSTHSIFSKAIGLSDAACALPGTTKGLFLHDLFGKILPKDRSLLTPTRRYLEWRLLTNNLGLTSWVILWVALCGLLSFSFVKNMTTIGDFSDGTARHAVVSGHLPSDLSAMDRFHKDILNVEEQNRHWWIPRFGLKESIEIEKHLKEQFCRQFQGSILAPLDRQLAGNLAVISAGASDDAYGQHAMHLVRRINLLKMRLKDDEMESLQAMPQPAFVTFLGNPGEFAGPDVKKSFGALYLSYLMWRTNTGETKKEIELLQASLNHLLLIRGSNLQWVAEWVNRQGNLSPISLRDFWGGRELPAPEKIIQPSFTRKGKQTADAAIAELEAAVAMPEALSAPKANFAAWYANAGIEAWYAFAAAFPGGSERLQGSTEWRQMAMKMTSDKNPYVQLFDRMTQELVPSLGASSAYPGWLQQVNQLQAARAQGFLQGSAPVKKVSQRGNRFMSALSRNVSGQAEAQRLDTQLAAAKYWQAYRGALQGLGNAAASRAQAFQVCSQTFAEDITTSRSPVYLAYHAANGVKSSLGQQTADPVVAQLISGPFNFLWSYLLKESATHLQTQWEEQVLAPTIGMPDNQAIPAMLGPDGFAWKFVKGTAAPFLTRDVSGYHPKEVLGGKMPLNGQLFNFMRRGAGTQVAMSGRNQTHNIGIKGLPTDANAEAAMKPHSTRIELQCGGNSQVLVNNNYPVGKTFYWSPESCGDVIFQIEVGDKVLSKHYMGPQGFPNFLRDMRGGRRVFSVNEFPGEKSALLRMGIKTITVNYQITGSIAVLHQVATLSGQAPRSITQ